MTKALYLEKYKSRATEHQKWRRLFEGDNHHCPKCRSPRMIKFVESDGDGYKCTVCYWTYEQLKGDPEFQPPLKPRKRRTQRQIYLDSFR